MRELKTFQKKHVLIIFIIDIELKTFLSILLIV